MTGQDRIAAAKARLKAGLELHTGDVRGAILESWLRCRDRGVPMENAHIPLLSPEELRQRIAAREKLCQTAVPFLDTLYDCIRGSEFLVLLSDEEGYILYKRGDPDILRAATLNGLVEGACRAERQLGTNGVGTVLAAQKPLQVWADEHYYELNSSWTCSGAPICAPDGAVIGAICLSGMAEKVNDHTLGMVVAAADAIARQLKLREAYDELESVWQNLNIIIESTAAAVCLLDDRLRIVAFNAQATKLLGMLPTELKGTDFLSLLGRGTVTEPELREGIANRAVEAVHGQRKCSLSLSVQPTAGKEFVVQMEPLSTLHKRVNNIVGNDAHFSFTDIVGGSPALSKAVQMARIAAGNEATVFLAGESGTGKELFAQSIHNAGARRSGPFIAVNCGALPKSLIEAELFGYESGSFTGARREGRAGKFELANGGTIFLDEIGDMPFDVQVMLLRVLQNREVCRIGASRAVKIDVRIITATNQNLEKMVREQLFREDLFYRINVFHIPIPPLRERTGDVGILAKFFLQKYTSGPGGIPGILPEAMARLERYDWPGNVRQLENTIERAVYLARDGVITPDCLPLEVAGGGAARLHSMHAPGEVPLSARQSERQRIEQALCQANGNVTAAAQLLEISRRTMYRKLHQYGLSLGGSQPCPGVP